jgi:hypothetical protein
MKTANILPQPAVGQLWECFEHDPAETHHTSSMFHPHVDIGDVVEIVNASAGHTVDICILRTGETVRENRYRLMYFYKQL